MGTDTHQSSSWDPNTFAEVMASLARKYGLYLTLAHQTLAQLNLICPPGTCWSYQNVAYDAASEAVERVTGIPYEQALRDNFFTPLGMRTASASRQGLMGAQSWARPHRGGRGSSRRAGSARASGGRRTTTRAPGPA